MRQAIIERVARKVVWLGDFEVAEVLDESGLFELLEAAAAMDCYECSDGCKQGCVKWLHLLDTIARVKGEQP